MMLRSIPLLASLALAIAVLDSESTAAEGGGIAYLHVSRVIDVYVMQRDGSEQHLLAKNSDSFAWSPRGSRLLVHRHEGGRHSIYVVNRDGTGLTRVTGGAIDPTWSPDETRIAFRDVEDGGIHTVRLEGTKAQRLTKPPAYGSDDAPAWSPNGRRIAFERWTGDVFQLALVTPDGDDLKVLLDCFSSCGTPVWSPSGRRLAFSDNSEIWVVNSDGTGLANLTNSPRKNEDNPTWSPSGRFLAFDSHTRGCGGRCTRRTLDIHTIRVDGRQHRNITREPGYDAYPDWSPDGRSIVFSSIRDGNIDLWAVTSTGRSPKNLTNHEQGWQNWSPEWAP